MVSFVSMKVLGSSRLLLWAFGEFLEAQKCLVANVMFNSLGISGRYGFADTNSS